MTAAASDPISDWPTEAVQAALERGDLEHWHQLAVQINREPWGTTARQVEEVLSHSRPYGVAEVMEAVIERARARTESRERASVAEEIRDAFARSGLTRAQFASRIGTSPSRLSTYLTGRVTPSASLLVRIRGVGERKGDGTAGDDRRKRR